jgi:hypothetical protein
MSSQLCNFFWGCHRSAKAKDSSAALAQRSVRRTVDRTFLKGNRWTIKNSHPVDEGNAGSRNQGSYSGCQKNVPVLKRFFYNHLCRNSVFRNFIMEAV